VDYYHVVSPVPSLHFRRQNRTCGHRVHSTHPSTVPTSKHPPVLAIDDATTPSLPWPRAEQSNRFELTPSAVVAATVRASANAQPCGKRTRKHRRAAVKVNPRPARPAFPFRSPVASDDSTARDDALRLPACSLPPATR
jgi:hypothetical protein